MAARTRNTSALTPLDAAFPIDRATAPCPEFWRALRPWETYSRPAPAPPSPAAQKFAAAEARRAVRQGMGPQEVFIRRLPPPEDLPAVAFVPRRRVYEELAEDTLAHEFAGLPPDATLIEEMTP